VATLNRLLPPTGPLTEADLVAAYAPDRTQPSLRVNFVTSLDGAVHLDGYSKGLSSDADRAVFGILRRHADAVLVGAGTLRHEGYRAIRMSADLRAWRRDQGLAEHPTMVVVSASLDLDPDDAAFADAPVRPVVLTHASADPAKQAALSSAADVVTCGESVVDLEVGLAELHRRDLTQILCEGGPHLFGALVAADLVDEFCLTMSPLLAGPGAGRIVAGATGPSPRELRPTQIIEADGALLTRYSRLPN
jgi:riboflavin biosynthesis pyrimidine reductase